MTGVSGEKIKVWLGKLTLHQKHHHLFNIQPYRPAEQGYNIYIYIMKGSWHQLYKHVGFNTIEYRKHFTIIHNFTRLPVSHMTYNSNASIRFAEPRYTTMTMKN